MCLCASSRRCRRKGVRARAWTHAEGRWSRTLILAATANRHAARTAAPVPAKRSDMRAPTHLQPGATLLFCMPMFLGVVLRVLHHHQGSARVSVNNLCARCDAASPAPRSLPAAPTPTQARVCVEPPLTPTSCCRLVVRRPPTPAHQPSSASPLCGQTPQQGCSVPSHPPSRAPGPAPGPSWPAGPWCAAPPP